MASLRCNFLLFRHFFGLKAFLVSSFVLSSFFFYFILATMSHAMRPASSRFSAA